MILHLKQYGAEGLRDDILNACVHHLAYDQQCEGTRTDWLISIIDLTGEEEFYRNEILKALSESKEYWEVDQLIELAEVFFKRGCIEAGNAIREKFNRREYGENILFAKAILDLDGISGLFHLADAIGCGLEEECHDCENEMIYDIACKRLGKETVKTEMTTWANTNENVRRFVNSMDLAREEMSIEDKKKKSLRKAKRSDLYL